MIGLAWPVSTGVPPLPQGGDDVADLGDESVYVEPGLNHARAVRDFEMQDQTPTPAAMHNPNGAVVTKFCDDHLDLTRQHIAEGEARIARQAILIARFKEHGLDTTEAETLLMVFRDSLALMREHQRHVQAESEKAS